MAYGSRPGSSSGYGSRPTTTSSYGSRATTSGGYGSRPTAASGYGSRSGKKKKEDDDEGGIVGFMHKFAGSPGDIMHTVRWMGSPIGAVLGSQSKNKKVRKAGNILQAVGSSPGYAAAHPYNLSKDIGHMVVGLAETPTAMKKSIEKVGFAKTMSLMYHATVDDYKTRYGKDWEKHAREHPLFNLADAFMVLGPALKGTAIASAAGKLGKVGDEASIAARAARGPMVKGGGSTAWKDLSPAAKLRIARAEAKQPGLMTTGKAATRDLHLQIGAGDKIFPEGKFIESSQALSHSPLRRGIQASLDDLASRYPDLPALGARSRIVRANAAQLPRTMDRALGEVVGLDALKGLNRTEKTRLWAQVQLVKHHVDPETGDILHDHGAVTAKIKDLRNALAEEFKNRDPSKMDEPDMQDWLLGAKQHGFGNALLKRLDDAAAYEPKIKPGSRYERAVQPLIQATNVAENVIGDTDGFARLEQDQKRLWDRLQAMSDGEGHVLPEHAEDAQHVAQQLDDVTQMLKEKGPRLQQVLSKRRNLLSDWVKANTPVDTPLRGQWAGAMADLGWSGGDIRDALRLSDFMAHRANPENPAQWYADKVGSPAGLTPEQLRVRAHALWQQGDVPDVAPEGFGKAPLVKTEERYGTITDPIHGDEHFEYVIAKPDSPYHSALQKTVEDNWGPKEYRQSGQVRSMLKEKSGISADEWKNSGLDELFFAGRDKNSMISKGQLQQQLSWSLNQYNLEETHLVNTEYAKDYGFGPKWGAGGGDSMTGIWDDELLSRNPGEGEYHEIFFTLPSDAKHAPDAYEGEGMTHWKKQNVVGHVRFQVFKEGGKTKLLIEEIQSDWGSDFRDQTKAGRQYGTPDPAWENTRTQLAKENAEARKAYEDESLSYRKLQEERDQARWRVEHFQNVDASAQAEAQAELDKLIPKAMEAESRFTEITRTYNEAHNALARHIDTRSGRIPPPPLSMKRAQRLAVNRVLRHAAENDIDEVLVTEGQVQNARNIVGPQGAKGGFAEMWHDFLSPEDGSVPLGRSVVEAGNWADEIIGDTHFHRIYEQEIPDWIEKRIGVKGEKVDDAYKGFIGTQTGARSTSGPMKATRFVLDDKSRAEARSADILYQKRDWEKIPKGANELLVGKGNRLIHLFKTADISTWVHELAHSAVFDLPEADAGILNAYYAGGKKVTSWADSSHESFARDFERYVRTADLSFLPRPVQEVFDRIQNWMQRVYREAKNANPDEEIPQDVQDVFARMLWKDNPSDTPDVFMPHRAGAPELTGARTSRGVPRAQRDLGDYTPSRVPIFARNRLGLLRSGLIHDDPNLLIEHVNRLISLQKANQLREFLLDKASPLMPGRPPNLETQYVIKRYGSSVDKPLYDALESAHNPSEIRTEISKYIDENLSDDPAVVKHWRDSGMDKQLYVIDKKTVDMLFKYVTGKTPGATTKPAGVGSQVIDATLNSMRGMLLYANPGFYVANFVGNLGMQMFNDPRSLKYLPNALKNGATLARGGKVDPLFERITVEMGRGPTSGGLSPERRGILGPELGRSDRTNIVGRIAEGTNQGLHRIGRNAGAVVDEPFRVAAWRQEASKMGYSTDAQVKKLLDDAIKDTRKQGYMTAGKSKAVDDLNSIRDKAEQLMLDFDSMTPFERTWLSRIIFLYPFLKASAKYPAMFAGEHPTLFGAAAQTSNVGQQFANQVLGPRPDLPLWAQGYARVPGGMANVGSIDQMSVLAGMMASATHLGQKTPVGINSPWEYLPPILQVAAEAARAQNRYGRESNIGEILKSDFAVPAWISALYRQPSALYTDRGEYGALLRSLRLAPFGVNPNYGADKKSGGGWGGSWGGGGSTKEWPK